MIGTEDVDAVARLRETYRSIRESSIYRLGEIAGERRGRMFAFIEWQRFRWMYLVGGALMGFGLASMLFSSGVL